MRRLRILVSLLGVTALGVLFAGAGTSYAFEWLCAGAAVVTKGNCLFRGVNSTPFTLQDIGAEYSIECAAEKVTSEGTVGPGAADETTAVHIAGEGKEPNCKPSTKALNLEGNEVSNTCDKLVSFAAVDTPWTTTLEEEVTGPMWWDLINTGKASGAGYETKCLIFGSTIEVADTCISGTMAESGSGEAVLVLLENLPEGLVGMVFNEVSLFPGQIDNCSYGSLESGLVKGEIILSAESGGKEVSLEIS
ncbi:MAG TPA: hypothetical protein VGP18_03560 [Solirubrobacteraceae bacterium]|nr:hypothetical protein [Solirubrobacteraceae bacterium]